MDRSVDIKELLERVESLESQVAGLMRENSELSHRISEIELYGPKLIGDYPIGGDCPPHIGDESIDESIEELFSKIRSKMSTNGSEGE